MAPKKQKGQKMALADFFADTTAGDWADDMDLPSAPAARDPSAPKRGDPGYLDSMPDRAARTSFLGAPSAREEVPIPTVPPFTAFVGNLTFETDEAELRDFFGDLEPTSVRLVKDATGKPKGFGYVEFASQDKLKEALGRSMSQLGGRTIRVSVAEAPSGRREYGHSAAEESNQWRRTGPLPARDPPPSARRAGSFNSPTEPQPERDWGAARGARFVPAPPAPSGGLRRDSSGPGRERDLPPNVADEAGQWRSSRPLAEAKRDLPPHQRGAAGVASGQTSPSLADTESTWSRASKLRTPATEAPSRSATDSPDERDWRSARATPAAVSRQGSVDGESPRLAPAAPAERRKLNLAPRSAGPASSTVTSPESTSDGARASIFGGAKPIDSATKEQEAAKKLAARDEERRAAQVKGREEEERKAKELSDERQRMIREAQEKAKAEIAGGKPAHGQGQRPPRVQPGRKASGDTKGVKSPISPKARPQPTLAAPEEGFEGVARGGGSRNVQSAATAAPVKKDAPVKKGFSFAAAAMAEGLVEDEEDGVEQASKRVQEGQV